MRNNLTSSTPDCFQYEYYTAEDAYMVTNIFKETSGEIKQIMRYSTLKELGLPRATRSLMKEIFIRPKGMKFCLVKLESISEVEYLDEIDIDIYKYSKLIILMPELSHKNILERSTGLNLRPHKFFDF